MKKTRILAFAAVVLVFITAGCATMPTQEQMDADIAGYTLPKQPAPTSALVYVVRPSGVGPIIRFNVFLDNIEDASEMGYTRGSQYIYFFVSPGRHIIYSKAENWAKITVTADPREVIFIKQVPHMGIFMARNSLEQIPDEEGKYFVKHASRGTIEKEQK